MGKWRGPEYEGEYPSLGWGVVEWLESLEIEVPAGEKMGELLTLSDSQVEYFVMWYRLNPLTGRRHYRRGQNMGPKGAGKSPEGALTCLAEFDGPIKFDGWDAKGEPIGVIREDAVVSIGGLAEGQTANMYDWLYTALDESAAAEANGWKVELGRITKQKGGYNVIEPSTSSSSTVGKPQTFVAKEETWLWTASSGMHRVNKAWTKNANKTGGTTCEYTNPPELGNNTIAELTQREAKKTKRNPIMLFHRTATLHDDIKKGGIKLAKNEKKVRAAIHTAYGDTLKQNGGWMDEEDVYDGIMEESTSEDDAYREWLGVGREVAGRIVTPADYDRHELVGSPIEDGALVALTFDGGKTIDSTCIMATTIEDVPRQEILHIWEKPLGPAGDGWSVPTSEVDEAMRYELSRLNVVVLGADIAAGWESLINDWEVEWGVMLQSKIAEFGTGLVFPIWWNSASKLVDEMTRLYKSAMESETTRVSHDPEHKEAETLRNHILRMSSKQQGKHLRPVKDEINEDAAGEETATGKQGQDIQIDAGICSIFGYWLARKKWEAYAPMVNKAKAKREGEDGTTGKKKRSSKLDRLANL